MVNRVAAAFASEFQTAIVVDGSHEEVAEHRCWSQVSEGNLKNTEMPCDFILPHRIQAKKPLQDSPQPGGFREIKP